MIGAPMHEGGRLRRLKDLRYGIFFGLLKSRASGLRTLGTDCAWTIQPDGLGPDSVIYSAGVGRHISFEKALVREYGCRVILLDPSPTGRDTMRQPENLAAQLHFLPVGLAAMSGCQAFALPENPDEGSFRRAEPGCGDASFPCETLRDVMERFGHTHIDLLKMDIEGFEYEVIDEILAERIPVRQLCVEYHHWMGTARSRTIAAVLKLRWAGFRLVHIHGWDHTYVRQGSAVWR